jgi:site-specific DNA-cytosine methylase
VLYVLKYFGPSSSRALGRVDGVRVVRMAELDPLDEVSESRICRARLWSEIAFECLPAARRAHLRKRCRASSTPLSYSSDCSGVDAPKFSLQDINAAIYKDAVHLDPTSIRSELQYISASEVNDKEGDGARLAMTLNGSPAALVCDATGVKKAGKFLKAYDSYFADVTRLGKENVYTVGFECQDRSYANLSNPKELVIDADNDDCGRSSRTLAASVLHIKVNEPEVFIMEHPYKKDTIAKVKHIIKNKLKKYRHRMWVTCSRQFGLPMRRRRLFVVGFNVTNCKLLVPMKDWTPILCDMAEAQCKEPLLLQDCTLPANHRYVVAELSKHMEDTPPSEEDVNGKTWPRSFKHHVRIRAEMQTAFKKQPPSVVEWMGEHFKDNTWMKHLPVREVEVLLLHAFALEHGCGVEFSKSSFCWDPCWSIGFAQKKHEDEQGCMPCQLRAHRPWYQGAKRYLLGLEMLHAHGFPKDFKFSLQCPGADPDDVSRARRFVAEFSNKRKKRRCAKR